MTLRRFAEDVEPGMPVGPFARAPSSVDLFRFSAATWNSHRIHYDSAYAREEGYPDVLVQSHLHGAYLAHAVLSWAGEAATLRRFRWENRHYAVPGDTLTCLGQVELVELQTETGLVHCAVQERNQDGVLCAPAWALVELPRRRPLGGRRA